MKRLPLSWLVALSFIMMLPAMAAAQPKVGDAAPEFPVGQFADGKRYQLSDFKGKVVVLFFYEAGCPRCKGTIPERNEVVKAFEGKPVKFLAIGAGDSFDSAVGYGRETKLQMPIFADNLSLMESRYGQKISLQNIYQFRVIGPDGKIVGNDMSKATIEKALEKATWKYDPKEYDPKLKPALDALEWNQLDVGLKLLAPLRRSPTKALAESANKLYDAVKKEAEGWKEEAEKVADTDPVKAYDLYTKLVTFFPTESMAKEVFEPRRKLAANKAVMAELNARKAFDQLSGGIVSASPNQKQQVTQQLQGFLKKFGGTPTGDKAAALAKEVEK